MEWFDNLKVKYKFGIVLIIVALGVGVFFYESYNTVQQVKINGDMYGKIIDSKDLIADILPPPDYIVESHLTCFQMLDEHDPQVLDELYKAKDHQSILQCVTCCNTIDTIRIS